MRWIWAGALLVLGAVSLAAGWAGWLPAAVFAGAALLPVLLFAAGARLRIPIPLIAIAMLAAAAIGVNLMGLPLEAVQDSIARLLTAPRPASATPELLLPGAAAALLIGMLVALRSGRVAAPVGAVVLYGFGALLTAGSGDPAGLLAGAIVLLTVAGWIDHPLRTAGRVVPGVAIAAAAALLAGLPAIANAFEPRDLVEPPQRTLAEPSPLPRLAAWHERPEAELMRVTAPAGTRLRLVTLASYTGVAWSATANYRPLGAVARPVLPQGKQLATIDTQVTITELDGLWLPGPGHPVETSLSDVDVEPDSGSIALRTGGLTSGMRYQIRAVVDNPTPEAVASATVPASAGQYLETPRLPKSFTEYAQQVTLGANTPFERAVAIEDAVRAGRRYDPAAPVGSSYARLETFLFRPDGTEAGAQIGSSEQFAAAFAVLARAAGLPSRVVLGFHTDGPIVRGKNALAWPEVYFSGSGWYAFDPTPLTEAGPRNDDKIKQLALARIDEASRVAPPPTRIPVVRPSSSPSGAAVAAPPRDYGFLIGPVSAGTGLMVLVLLGFVIVARQARRVRHRRAGVRGAWSELLDLLVLLGRVPAASRPAPSVAAEFASIAPETMTVAMAADRAAFAPVSADQNAPATWLALRVAKRALRRTAPLWRRLFWPIDPRPLLRRR